MVLVDFAQSYVFKLTPGPIGRQHHVVPQIALHADRSLIASGQRKLLRKKFCGSFQIIKIRKRIRSVARCLGTDFLGDRLAGLRLDQTQ